MLRATSALAGGAAGFVVMALIDPAQRSTHLDVYAIAAGAILAALGYQLLAARN
jgi:hypothetical protein